jgi:hypothetical protein
MGEEKSKKAKSRRRFRIILPLFFLLLIMAAIGLFVKNMNGPAEGTVAYKSQSEPPIKPTSSTPKKYDGKYIGFTYPEHYKVVAKPPTNGGYLEIISLDNTDHTGKYISVGVIRENIMNDSGVGYRKGHPELFKQTLASPDKIVFAGTSTSAEQTGFLAHNGLVATISVTANGQRDLSADFNTIVNSLSWKQ